MTDYKGSMFSDKESNRHNVESAIGCYTVLRNQPTNDRCFSTLTLYEKKSILIEPLYAIFE